MVSGNMPKMSKTTNQHKLTRRLAPGEERDYKISARIKERFLI